MFLKKFLLAFSLLSLGHIAHAHEFQSGDITIVHPWSRELPAVAPTAAAYFVLKNQGSEADRLLSATTRVAGRAELHEHVHAGGAMKMQQVMSVEIPAGGEVKFEPMGYHVMLLNLKQQAKAGEHFPLTLIFEKAGALEVDVVVQKDAPTEHQPDHSHSEGHQH
ncbi:MULTISPECIES: copper chaperone PCu(A)C [unclassified Pseudomonas]|uniref:copper chaperone PCu(A)C n=1 Tax=unclassified Pseudomonas TaxID=196821 RepID=UPI00131FC987|nr:MULTISPECIES: copper chaperone PCu(A)C [unclassified Pseudomonas]NJJ56136.1 copper chaperone PCu(A)C [Pseudomonas sp. B14(2022)]QHD00700.1 hypothetical protein PspS04_10085 [Pseudomonas sp. S04]QHF33185.1 hypothetical protein PspS19_10085 [Pseudomonas sp. S19]